MPRELHSKHFSHKRASSEASYMNCVKNVFGFVRWTYYVHDTWED